MAESMGEYSDGEQPKGTHNVLGPLSQATRLTPMMPKVKAPAAGIEKSQNLLESRHLRVELKPGEPTRMILKQTCRPVGLLQCPTVC